MSDLVCKTHLHETITNKLGKDDKKSVRVSNHTEGFCSVVDCDRDNAFEVQ